MTLITFLINRIKPLGLLLLVLFPATIYCQSTGSENSVVISNCEILSTTELLLECDIRLTKNERFLKYNENRFILVMFAQVQEKSPIYILNQHYIDQRQFGEEQIKFEKNPPIKTLYPKKKIFHSEVKVLERDSVPIIFSYLNYGNNFLPLKLTIEEIRSSQNMRIIPVVMWGNPNSFQKVLYVMDKDPFYDLFQMFQKLRLVEIEVIKYTYLNYSDCD